MASKLNKILFGPPGTGKTFHSISYAVAICDNKGNDYITKCLDGTQDRAQVLERFHELLSSGRIRFITFHQSLGYEDFILGIKPKLDESNSSLKYELVPGIFYNLCEDAKKELLIMGDITQDAAGHLESTNYPLVTDPQLQPNPQIPLNLHNKINFSDANQTAARTLIDVYRNSIANLPILNVAKNDGTGNLDYYNHFLWGNIQEGYVIASFTEKAITMFKVKDGIQNTEVENTNNYKQIVRALIVKALQPEFRLTGKVTGLFGGNTTNLGHLVEDIIRSNVENSWINFSALVNQNDNGDRILLHRFLNQLDQDHDTGVDVLRNDDAADLEEEQSNEEESAENQINTSSAKKDHTAYVLIIDEINRGNVSNIFGELITLIEDSKRVQKYEDGGIDSKGNRIYNAVLADEALELTIPNTDKKFSVPANVRIIGTMNTADRSVEALDTALRRRFDFVPMPPDPSLLSGIRLIDAPSIDLQNVLKRINQRIEALIDSDHTIGHSFFINVKSKAELINTFKNNIIPLLQEYFYGNAERIGWVLGEGFVNAAGDSYNGGFAKFDNIDEDLAKPSISIKKLNDNFPIVEAIEWLINEQKQ